MYRLLPAGVLRAQQLSESNSASNTVATLISETFERLRRAVKSRAYSKYLEREEVPNDWARQVSLKLEFQSTKWGRNQSKRWKTDRNSNHGAIVGFRDILLHALQMDEEVISKQPRQVAVPNQEYLENLVAVFNLLLETWAQAFENWHHLPHGSKNNGLE